MTDLAINGGQKIREKKFARYNPMGMEEIQAVQKVMEGGVLSKYLGSWGPDFLGGKEVQAFEKEWAMFNECKHAIAVNSNSSGVHAALGAIGVGYGDEVIVSPYSMSVSATAPLVWNATPIFADVNKTNYCLDIEDVKRKITDKTKAIIIVHIFGSPADMDELLAVTKDRGIYVIEDCAQAPGASYKGRPVGTLGDIGVYSLNYHKHIHTGEGGICVTNDDDLAVKMQLIRNHAEVCVEKSGVNDLTNMLGYNFRMTELQAAMGRVQLRERLLPELELRRKYAAQFSEALNSFEFINVPTQDDRVHSYYVQAFQFDEGVAGVAREKYLEAVRAELEPVEGRENEGVPIYGGYTRPLYMLPIFQNKKCYKGLDVFGSASYEKGTCLNTEELHHKILWYHDFTRGPLSQEDVNDVIAAYTKVAKNIDQLR
jgi:perosamine synthetase